MDEVIAILGETTGTNVCNPKQVAELLVVIARRANCTRELLEKLGNVGTEMTAEDALQLHFKCNISYTALKLLLRALTSSMLVCTITAIEVVRKTR